MTEQLELDAVAAFVEVVASGGFSAAARQLLVTKSAVSKRIARLEEQLGVRLIQRRTRPLTLTEAGERFHAHAAAAMEAIAQAERAATELQDQPRGHLRVLSLMSFGRLHVAPLVARFLARYPGVEIDLILDDRRGAIASGDFDVAIRAGELPDSTLVARKLTDLGSVVCAAPCYLERREHRRPEHPRDLLEHDCLVYTYSGTPSTWAFTRRGGEAVTVDVHGRCGVNNGEALAELVLAGAGVSRLPTFIAEPLIAAGRLVPLLTEYTMPSKGLYAVWHERRYLPQKVRVFVDFLVEALAANPPS